MKRKTLFIFIGAEPTAKSAPILLNRKKASQKVRPSKKYKKTRERLGWKLRRLQKVT